MPRSTYGSGARWCAKSRCHLRCSRHSHPEGKIDDQQRLVLTIELGQMEDACRARVGHGRRLGWYTMPVLTPGTLLAIIWSLGLVRLS